MRFTTKKKTMKTIDKYKKGDIVKTIIEASKQIQIQMRKNPHEYIILSQQTLDFLYPGFGRSFEHVKLDQSDKYFADVRGEYNG